MATLDEIRSEVVEVYIGYFNRAPDYDGLEYWVQNMSNGWNINDVSASFFQSQEVAELYPVTLTNSTFINTIYNNVLGRSADENGKNYWITELESGRTSRDQMIIAIINGAKSDTGDPIDKLTLSNKRDVGEHFGVDLKLNDIPLAKSSMELVTSDSVSVNLAKDKQDIYYLSLTETNIIVEGTEEADLLTSLEKDIYLYSWAGNDIITTDTGKDTVVAGAGDDTIYSNSGDDIVYGRDGNDTVYAGSGDDIIYGNENNDSLHGELGNDTIYGNSGNDYLYGDDGDDFIVGNEGNDFIYGGLGNDTIFGNDGDDIITTNDGVDFVDAGAGDDLIHGGTGVDSLHGGEGNDTIFGYEGNDILDGLIGNDIIYAGSGADIINGNDGNDILYGDSGIDRIDGEKGDDIIYGGLGSDVLSGGEGSDIFTFIQQESTMLNLDLITDFEYSVDKVKLVNQGIEVISSTAVNISSATNLQTAVDMAMLGDGSTNALVKWFSYEDNTYIVEDLSADVIFNNTTDILIKLQGFVNLEGLDTNTILFN